MLNNDENITACYNLHACLNQNENIVNFVLAIATILISVIALYISIKNASKQNKIALFDHRYKVYEKFVEIGDLGESFNIKVLPPGWPNNLQGWNNLYRSVLVNKGRHTIANIAYNDIDFLHVIKVDTEILKQADFLFKLNDKEKRNVEDFNNACIEFTKSLLTMDGDFESKKKDLEILFEKDYHDIIKRMQRQLKL